MGLRGGPHGGSWPGKQSHGQGSLTHTQHRLPGNPSTCVCSLIVRRATQTRLNRTKRFIVLRACFYLNQALLVVTSLMVFAERCCGQKVYFYQCQGRTPCKEGLAVKLKLTSQTTKKVYSYRIKKVTDKDTGQKVSLTEPIPLQVSVYPSRLIYPLELMQIVNNRPYEVFFHADNSQNYHGCNDQVLSQLCNQSWGFCCNCDKKAVNHPYHIRGGQDCKTNKSSVHCLQYDTLWYSLNEINNPTPQYVVGIATKDPYTRQGSSVRVGSDIKQSEDNQLSVTFTLTSQEKHDPLNYQMNYLLIPETVKKDFSKNMMLVQRSLVGKTCNKIGVSTESFLKQTEKCIKPSQSCLDMQPMDLWLEDIGRTMQQKPAKYFLKNIVNGDVKIMKQKSSDWFLAVPVSGIQFTLVINISRNDLSVIPKQHEHLIREVVYLPDVEVDTLYVMLFNPGYNSIAVFIQIYSCNVKTTGTLFRQWSLPPQSSNNVQFRFMTSINSGRFTCTVLVKAVAGEDTIKIDLNKNQKCVCYPSLTCRCEDAGYHRYILIGSKGLFYGPTDIKFVVSMLITVLILVGVIKAVISLWSPVVVGQAGLCLFMKSRILSSYIEKDLKKYDILYNDRGVPVHPVTRQPVQILSNKEIFLLNLCFGFYILASGLHWLMLKVLGLDVKYKYERESRLWHQKLLSYEMFSAKRLEDDMESDVPDKVLVYEQYRKHKRELSLRSIGVALSTEAFMKHQASENNFIRESKKIPVKDKYPKMKGRSLNKKMPIQDLLKLDHVFFNYQKESQVLKNSGKCYSLCGILTRSGRRYNFELGPYNVQMNENIDGKAQKLENPEQIVHPILYSTELNTTAVHQFITTHPLFPCLNTYITYRDKQSPDYPIETHKGHVL